MFATVRYTKMLSVSIDLARDLKYCLRYSASAEPISWMVYVLSRCVDSQVSVACKRRSRKSSGRGSARRPRRRIAADSSGSCGLTDVRRDPEARALAAGSAPPVRAPRRGPARGSGWRDCHRGRLRPAARAGASAASLSAAGGRRRIDRAIGARGCARNHQATTPATAALRARQHPAQPMGGAPCVGLCSG